MHRKPTDYRHSRLVLWTVIIGALLVGLIILIVGPHAPGVDDISSAASDVVIQPDQLQHQLLAREWQHRIAEQQAAQVRSDEQAVIRQVVPSTAAVPLPTTTAIQTPAPLRSSPPPASSGTWWPGTSFGQCVRAKENGGSYAWGTGNGGGAYQFEPALWSSYAPSGAIRGQASAAQQDQAFQNVMTNASQSGGAGNWQPYDGCSP